MRVLLQKMLGRAYRPLNEIIVNEKRLIANYRYLESLRSGTSIAPVLKSNAYGHGLIPVARIAERLQPPFICVDSLFEAYEIHKAGIKTPLLIMGYVYPENLKVKRLPFSYAVWDRKTACAIAKYQPQAEIHIFVDTGMHREGIGIKELPQLLKELTAENRIKINGMLSHLAAAGQPDSSLTKKQYSTFLLARKILHRYSLNPRWLHLNASSGHIHGPVIKELNLSRCGLAFYGLDPSGKNRRLQPALSLESTLAQIKNVAKGEKIGYDFTYRAKRDIALGILPMGYNDGLNRRLSNRGEVEIGGISCPITGRVSMNVTAADITSVINPAVGMRASVISQEAKASNSLENIAAQCATIPYEILVQLHPSIRRSVK